ncbi:MAG TPA: FAD-dependent monooxygenase [Gemmatimonadaceae bacterium]|nr:FAD-dependent monooxygenase [Gemmatimonadaceae bacterium]
MSRTPVLIVGAGPTGLVLALWLTKSGVAVRIIDKAAQAGTTSRALAVQARTLEFYEQLDFARAVVDAGVKVAAVNLWVRGRRTVRAPIMDIGRGSSPFPFPLVYPQDAHETLLVDRLAALGVQVERRTELVSFEQGENGVSALLRHADGAQERCEASYLAGCDGAHSKVREGLGIGFPGGTYEHMFYVADAQANGPVADHELHVDLDTSDFIAVFPMKGEHRIRLIGSVSVPLAGEQHALTFADVSAAPISQMKIEIEKVNWFSTYRVHHRVALSFQRASAFLLGDAAHIHSPVGGQGMNTGIGDAVNLAWKLAAVLHGEAGARLLDSYEPERIAFARKLVATTDRAFTIATKSGPLAAFMRGHIVPLVVPWLFRFGPMRRFLFRTVSQIGVAYPDSPLSVGSAGRVRGGDRLPWVPLSETADNFAPLASRAWQAHVYGSVHASAEAACAELRLPLHVFAWSPEAARAGLARSAFYLVRPDGYVALADGDGSARGLRQYLADRELAPGTPRFRDGEHRTEDTSLEPR